MQLTSLMITSWRSTLAGVIGFLFSLPLFIQAITDWSNHRPVDWRQVVIGLAISAVSTGLGVTKDAAVHSTFAQVEASQAKVEGKPDAPALVKAADAQVDAAKSAPSPPKP
jgi:hypothetical protein